MEESTLYSLLDNGLVRKWREMIEQAESESWFFKNEQNTLKALEAELNEQSKKLLTSYSLAKENRIDYIHYNLKLKVLNYGIKIGMDLQKALTELEE